MDRILLIIFAFILLPYMGIPNTYDIWIVFVLLVLLVHALYLFIQTHNLFRGRHLRMSLKQSAPSEDVSDRESESEDGGTDAGEEK